MDSRVSVITLAAADLDRSRAFYEVGLGWVPELSAPDIVMYRAGEHLVLALWAAEAFAAEVGYEPERGHAPLTLAHNVATPQEVDAVLAAVREVGAPDVREAESRDWGGYSGYFSDPDGYRWEVAHNPTPLGASLLP